MMALKHNQLTKEIISTFYHVYNTLGYGFLEKIYENAMAYELRKRGYTIEQQAPIKVHYDGIIVGEYYADLLVNESVMLELKSTDNISKAHEAQLINYLKATNIEVGLDLNFGPKPQVSRKVYETARQNKN